MTKQEILESVDGEDESPSTKVIIKSYIEEAYNAGFDVGFESATQIQSRTGELLMPALLGGWRSK